MYKIAIAAVAAVTVGVMSLPASAETNADTVRHVHRGHHRDVRGHYAVRGAEIAGAHDGFVMNGDFDWRRRRPGYEVPWYANGYSGDCYAWTPHAYHYACDVNSRY